MKCPRHGVELEPRTVESNVVDRCPQCGGLWVPGVLIDKVVGEEKRALLRNQCSTRTSKLLCPTDGIKLGEGTVSGVTIDCCGRCNGLWLDWGELERLKKLRKSAFGDGDGELDPLDVVLTADLATEVILGLMFLGGS